MIDPALAEEEQVVTARTLRQFAGISLVFFGGLAAWHGFVTHRRLLAIVLAAIAVVVGGLGLARPERIRALYLTVLALTTPVGKVVTYIVLGVLFYGSFVGEGAHAFWHETIFVGEHQEEGIPTWVILAPFVVSVLGLGVAYYYYILHPELPPQMAAKKGMLYTFLYNKWYFDELYDLILVRPAFWLARQFWKIGDGKIIDGLGPDGVASRVLWTTGRVVKLQTGYIYHYALAMLVGAAALATWFLFSGQA